MIPRVGEADVELELDVVDTMLEEPNVEEDESWELDKLSTEVEDGTREDGIVLELRTVEELLRMLLLDTMLDRVLELLREPLMVSVEVLKTELKALLLDKTLEALKMELLTVLLIVIVEEMLEDPGTENDERMDELRLEDCTKLEEGEPTVASVLEELTTDEDEDEGSTDDNEVEEDDTPVERTLDELRIDEEDASVDEL